MIKINRSELREKIMTILYQIELYKKNKIEYDIDELIKNNIEIDNEFVKNCVYGITTYEKEIDKVINTHLIEWKLSRLGLTDIAILRLGTYELLYTDTPEIVSINEAIELAKKYSDDKIVKMVNATLDKIYKDK